MTRKRRFGSLANELVKKAREAMLTAVQIFNNPHVEFKSELFIVTTIIRLDISASCPLPQEESRIPPVHARCAKVPFFTYQVRSHPALELRECLDCSECPLEEIQTNNL